MVRAYVRLCLCVKANSNASMRDKESGCCDNGRKASNPQCTHSTGICSLLSTIELVLVLQWLFTLMPMLHTCPLFSPFTPHPSFLSSPIQRRAFIVLSLLFPPSPFLRPIFHPALPFPSLPPFSRTLALALILYSQPRPNLSFSAHAHILLSIHRISSFSAVVCVPVCLLLCVVGAMPAISKP